MEAHAFRAAEEQAARRPGDLNFVTGDKTQDEEVEPIAFWLGPNGKQERFQLVPSPSVLAVMSLTSVADLNARNISGAELVATLAAIYDFLHEVLEDGDWRRFRRCASRWGLDLDDLAPVVLGLVEAIYGLPTQPPRDSHGSPSTSSRSSTVDEPSPAATVSFV